MHDSHQFFLFALGNMGSIALGNSTRAQNEGQSIPKIAHYQLLWSDEFEIDGPPNPANWTYKHGFVRNDELQWYQEQKPSASTVCWLSRHVGKVSRIHALTLRPGTGVKIVSSPSTLPPVY